MDTLLRTEFYPEGVMPPEGIVSETRLPNGQTLRAEVVHMKVYTSTDYGTFIITPLVERIASHPTEFRYEDSWLHPSLMIYMDNCYKAGDIDMDKVYAIARNPKALREPVVIAAMPDGKACLIDGHHRITARVLLHGLTWYPCVLLTREQTDRYWMDKGRFNAPEKSQG